MIVKNLVKMILLLLGVSGVAFFLVTMPAVDPLQTNVGQAALGSMSPEQIEKLELYWGVNTPRLERFIAWIGGVLQGDMGTSLLYRRPVLAVIGEKFSNSAILMITAWILAGISGLIMGIVAGAKQGSLTDKVISGYCLMISSTPTFWLALVLLLIFGMWLHILPIGLSVPIGMEAEQVSLSDRILHAILPAITLSITGVSHIALHTREKMIEIMESDYVLFAKARGESKYRILVGHGVRNVLLPAITLQFGLLSEIFGGSILVEQVFSYPGLGQAAVTAGLGGDVPLLLGITVISAAIVFLGNFTANILYGVVDPRIRRGGKTA